MASFLGRNPSAVLKAKRRMSVFLLILLLVFFAAAGLTFPFVDHASRVQNILYGLAVTAPFAVINIIFIVLTGKDLKRAQDALLVGDQRDTRSGAAID